MDAKVGTVVEYNRGDGPEYGIVVAVEENGDAHICALGEASPPFKVAEGALGGGEYRVAK